MKIIGFFYLSLSFIVLVRCQLPYRDPGGFYDPGVGGDVSHVCYRRGEEPVHDFRHYLVRCYSLLDCTPYGGNCYFDGHYPGVCCRGHRHPGGDPHCPDGSPSAGYCFTSQDCPHRGAHFRCAYSYGGVYPNRGLCCLSSGPFQAGHLGH